jgi:hypothetical protein
MSDLGKLAREFVAGNVADGEIGPNILTRLLTELLQRVVTEAEAKGWADCVRGVEMTRDTFREGTASRAACEVVLADLRKLAALP